MNYWLVKTEKETYSFQRLMKERESLWDGVRNYQARNNLKLMSVGDPVLIYHSVSDREIVGVGVVSKEALPEPGDETGRWFAPVIAAVKELNRPVTLAEVKMNDNLQDLPLVKHSRLSVMPVSEMEYQEIIRLSELS